jgi:hypothetical protein
MEISWPQYVLLLSGLCFVLIGLYERLGRDRLARRLKLAPGEAGLLGSVTLLHFIYFTIEDHAHWTLVLGLLFCTWWVCGGLVILAHRKKRSAARRAQDSIGGSRYQSWR